MSSYSFIFFFHFPFAEQSMYREQRCIWFGVCMRSAVEWIISCFQSCRRRQYKTDKYETDVKNKCAFCGLVSGKKNLIHVIFNTHQQYRSFIDVRFVLFIHTMYSCIATRTMSYLKFYSISEWSTNSHAHKLVQRPTWNQRTSTRVLTHSQSGNKSWCAVIRLAVWCKPKDTLDDSTTILQIKDRYDVSLKVCLCCLFAFDGKNTENWTRNEWMSERKICRETNKKK